MDKAHTLIAAADVRPTLSESDASLVQQIARSLVESSPADLNAKLRAMFQNLASGSSAEAAAETMSRDFALAVVPERDAEKISQALQLEATSFSVSAARQSSLGVTASSAHTQILYVNGMMTQPNEAELAWRGALSPLADRRGVGSAHGFLVTGFYDPTFLFDDPAIERFWNCIKLKALQFSNGIINASLTMPSCIPSAGLAIQQTVYGTLDLAEAAAQVITLAFKASPLVLSNARKLADQMLSARQRGERVILVTHSRGNLVVGEALLYLSSVGTWTQKDRSCIGWISIAPPVEPAQDLTVVPPTAVIVRGNPSVDILEKIFAVTRHNIVEGRRNELSDDYDAMGWFWRNALEVFGVASGIALHSSVSSYFGMPATEAYIGNALWSQVDALDTNCDAATATVRVNSNESATWTLGPGDVTRSGSQTVNVRAARLGTQFTLTPAAISGKTVSVSNSVGSGNTMTLMPGDDRTFTITYSAAGNATTASLTANPQTVAAGQASALTWTSTNANSCNASWTSSTATSGSATVTPGNTSTYSITCSGTTGSATAQTTVTVSGSLVPSAPTSLAASAAVGLISLAWSDNSTNESGFRIERASSGSSNFSEIGTTGVNVAAFIDASVTPGTSYDYRVRAYSNAGNSGYSNVVTATALSGQTAPSAPSNLSASPTSAIVSLAWSDNSTNETGFRIERAPGTSSTFAEIGTTGSNIAAFIDQSVSAATAYSYRIRAYNSGGTSAYSNTINVTTLTTGGCPSPIVIDASIDGTATWSPGPSGCVHYLVKGSVIVWGALNIQAGTSIAFAANAQLEIQGSLSAIGTAASPIRFIGEQQVRGYWRGITFYSNSAANELTHVEVAYGGGGGSTNAANVTVDAFDRLKLTNSLVRESAGVGLYVDNEASIPSFSANVLRNNTKSGIRIGAEQLGQLDTGSDYITANGTNYLDVYGTSIRITQTWRITSAPIHLTGTTLAWNPLTISPGMTFLLGSNAAIDVQGSLTAVGTAGSPIRFIGEQQVRGYWQGITFYGNSAANELTYVEVAYAGGGGSTNAANITVDAFDRLKLTNSLIRESAGIGLYVDNEASIPSFSTNVLRNNTKSGIRIGAEQLGQLDTGSDYVTANGTNYLDVYGTSIRITQTWRITSAPIHLTGTTLTWNPLTISPGMTFLLGSNAAIDVQGSLTAVGTAGSPIRFIGEQQVRGYWRGITFYSNSAANELTYVEVAYGGGGGTTNAANIAVDAFDRLKLTNSIMRESAGWGLYVDPAGTITPSPVSSGGNSFSNNTKGGSNVP